MGLLMVTKMTSVLMIEKIISIKRISVGGSLRALTLMMAIILKIAKMRDKTPRLRYDIFSLSTIGN